MNARPPSPPIVGAVGFDGGYKPAIALVIPRKRTPKPELIIACPLAPDILAATFAGIESCGCISGGSSGDPFKPQLYDRVEGESFLNGYWPGIPIAYRDETQAVWMLNIGTFSVVRYKSAFHGCDGEGSEVIGDTSFYAQIRISCSSGDGGPGPGTGFSLAIAATAGGYATDPLVFPTDPFFPSFPPFGGHVALGGPAVAGAACFAGPTYIGGGTGSIE